MQFKNRMKRVNSLPLQSLRFVTKEGNIAYDPIFSLQSLKSVDCGNIPNKIGSFVKPIQASPIRAGAFMSDAKSKSNAGTYTNLSSTGRDKIVCLYCQKNHE